MSPIDSSFSLEDYIELQKYTDSKVSLTAHKSKAIAELTEKLMTFMSENPSGTLSPVPHDPLAPVIQKEKGSVHIHGVTNQQLKDLQTQALVKIQEAMLWSIAQKSLSNVYNYLRGSSSSQLISKLGVNTLKELVENLKKESSDPFASQKIQMIKVKSDITKERLLQTDQNLMEELNEIEENIFKHEYHVDGTDASMNWLLINLGENPVKKMISAITNFFSFSGAVSTPHKILRNMPDGLKQKLIEALGKKIDDIEVKFAFLLNAKMPFTTFNDQLIEVERMIQAINHDSSNPTPLFSQLKTRFQALQKAVQEKKSEIKTLYYRVEELNNDGNFLANYANSYSKIPLASFEGILTRLDKLLTFISSDSSLLRGEKKELMDHAQRIITNANNTNLSRTAKEYTEINAKFELIKKRFVAVEKAEEEKSDAAKKAMLTYVTDGIDPSIEMSYQKLDYKDLTELYENLKKANPSNPTQITRWKEVAENFLKIQGFHTIGKITLERMIASDK